jgi:hypothetical protein
MEVRAILQVDGFVVETTSSRFPVLRCMSR